MASSKDKPSTEVATVSGGSENYPILSDDGGGIAEILEENFGGDGINQGDLDRVKIPAGGGTTWEVPDLEAEDGLRSERALEGVIVAWQKPRTYWATKAGDGDPQPPDCSSPDSEIGMGLYGPGSAENPTGECATCPMNEWGSAVSDDGKPGRGKACKEQRLLYLLQPHGILPLMLNLPPTSIQPLRKYLVRLASARIPYYAVSTKFTLKKETAGSNNYSTVVPSMGERLSPEQAKAAKALGESIIASSRRRPDEVAGEAYASDVADAEAASA